MAIRYFYKAVKVPVHGDFSQVPLELIINQHVFESGEWEFVSFTTVPSTVQKFFGTTDQSPEGLSSVVTEEPQRAYHTILFRKLMDTEE